MELTELPKVEKERLDTTVTFRAKETEKTEFDNEVEAAGLDKSDLFRGAMRQMTIMLRQRRQQSTEPTEAKAAS